MPSPRKTNLLGIITGYHLRLVQKNRNHKQNHPFFPFFFVGQLVLEWDAPHVFLHDLSTGQGFQLAQGRAQTFRQQHVGHQLIHVQHERQGHRVQNDVTQTIRPRQILTPDDLWKSLHDPVHACSILCFTKPLKFQLTQWLRISLKSENI